MRASSVSIDTISVHIPDHDFIDGPKGLSCIRGYVVNDEPSETRRATCESVCTVSVAHISTCMCYYY